MDQLRVLLRTLNHRFGSETLYREVRGILSESAAGNQQMEGTDRAAASAPLAPLAAFGAGLAAGAVSGFDDDEDDPEPRRRRSQSAWESAVQAASQEQSQSPSPSAPSRGGSRDPQSQGKLAAARRALGG